METSEVQYLPFQAAKPNQEINLTQDDLKRITDFFSILISIDQRLKREGVVDNEK